MMCFISSSADLQQFGVTPKSFNLVFTNVTISAKNLNSSVGDPFAHGATVKFDAIGIEAIAIRGEIKMSGDVVDVGSSRLTRERGKCDLR